MKIEVSYIADFYLGKETFMWYIHQLASLYRNSVSKGNNENVNPDPITSNPTRLDIR
jgi:hypothetical protein